MYTVGASAVGTSSSSKYILQSSSRTVHSSARRLLILDQMGNHHKSIRSAGKDCNPLLELFQDELALLAFVRSAAATLSVKQDLCNKLVAPTPTKTEPFQEGAQTRWLDNAS
jgi:hypothetical protein